VRTFSQDDAHIFCTTEQIEGEITALFDFIFEIYELFGFSDVRVFLSTRPEKAMGDPEVWQHAEKVLEGCLANRTDVDFTVKPGDGAFYGPKIDFDVQDALGRAWQLATIQLDFQMPERFDLSFVDSGGEEKRPVMIHRAILGSLERFYGVMLEHFGGDLPPWLAPEQVRVLPITDSVLDYADRVCNELTEHGLRATVDRRSEKLGYKIREGEAMKVPYLLVVGQREAESGHVSLRLRHRRDEGVWSLDDVINRIVTATDQRSLEL
jgi:threonyl-tRNA synthetase